MVIDSSLRHGCLIITFPEEVDIANADTVREQLHDVCRLQLAPENRNGITTLVADWSAAPLLTMAGVGVLDELRRRAHQVGVPLKVVMSGRTPRAVLRVVGLDTLIPLYDTVDQALAAHAPTNRNIRSGDLE
ncbi:STAS domain-containing protein [Streptomyces violascens]|uniref:STAS domain-containing protein n=1 Tax=Streptomyces violascens TaxID=67381 RepID=UPI0036C6C6CA